MIQSLVNKDLEMSILGLVLIMPDKLSQLDLTDDDFCIIPNKEIWVAIKKLAGGGESVDLVTVATELLDMKAICDHAYLASTVDCATFTASLETQAKQLRDIAQRRAIYEKCTSIATRIVASEMSTNEAVSEAMRLSEIKTKSHKESTIIEICDETLSKIDLAQAGEKIPMCPTGFYELDKMLGGGLPHNLSVVGAPTGHGKTTFCDNVSFNAAMKGMTVGRITLEDSVQDIALSMANISAQIDNTLFFARHGMSIPQRMSIGRSMEQLKKLNIKCVDGSHDIDKINRTIDIWTAGGKRMDLIIVDHASEVEVGGFGDKQNLAIRKIVQTLGSRAVSLGSSVILVSQLNRYGAQKMREGEEAQNEFLIDSSDLEKRARAIILLWRPEEYSLGDGKEVEPAMRNVMICKVSKCTRGGRTGQAWLSFYGEHSRITDHTVGDAPTITTAEERRDYYERAS